MSSCSSIGRARERRCWRPNANTGIPTSITADGRILVFRQNSEATGYDIGMVNLEVHGSEPEMLLQTPAAEHTGMLSPDGRWLAYVSDASGRPEVYVASFPSLAPRTPVSTNGGDQPMWSRDGSELFYREGQKMMAVPVSADSGLSAGRPALLFEGYLTWTGGNPGTNYDVTPDGQGFVMIRNIEEEEEEGPATVVLVQGFFDELKRLAPRPD